MEPNRYRTIWISDLHLGASTCRAASLLGFLRQHDADRWYLVGDVFDGRAMHRSWTWEQAHNDAVQTLLRKAREGADVIYLPGQHDAFLQDYAGLHFGGISVRTRALHTTADGRQLLVLHGSRLRGETAWRWLSKLTGIDGRFAERAAAEARRCGVDGIVCGYRHRAEMHDVAGVHYLNCGDWVENCTALAERFDGRLEIIRWPAETAVPVCAEAMSWGDGLPEVVRWVLAPGRLAVAPT